MAEVVATIGASMIPVLLKPVMDKAKTAVVDLGFDIKREIEELHDTLEVIQGILPEAEEMQDVNVQIRHWLRKLVDIGYEARDVLDELVTISATTSGRYSSLPFHLLHRIVGSRGSSYVPVVLSRRLKRRLSNEVKNVRKRLDELEKQTKIVEQFRSMGGGSIRIPICSRPETGPFLNKQRDLFVGRRDVKEGIMEKLLNHNDSRVQIIPIWGMGGVGKTTFAQSIYNDGRVTEEEYPSKNRRWLCVGEKKFDAKEIISKITDELHGTSKITKSGTNDVEVIQRKLIEKFKGDRFLVVLDDIWDIDSSEWKLLWDPLTIVGKGGLIIVTTRTRDVISAINTPVPDDLRPLSYDDCWQIFESHAFINENSCSDLELKKSIGKQIVEKLKGLPLAAEVVGRALSNEPDVRNWTNFLDAREWKLSTRDDDVMRALRWSYNRLPSHLKQCFAYCSLFPKDHIFDEKTLVKMWMAHGFIQNVEGGGETRRPEDIGVSYFKQLVYASLFQYVDGKYAMHDMIHDLAVLVSNEEFLRTDGLLLNVGQLGKKIRHIYIGRRYFWENLSLCKSKRSTLNRLLTLYTVGGYSFEPLCKNVIRDTFKQFKSIRVLVLESENISYIPKCISELIHLRYLDIEETDVSRIPDTLCDLHNLQTLVALVRDFHYCEIVTVVPENIVNMVNLRHLRAHLPTCKGVKNLTSLQELHSISVSKGDKISELGDLRQLRGRLTIKDLDNVTSWEDAAQAMMQEKKYIDHLELEFMGGLRDCTDVQTKVLDALQCPPNLTYLKIDGYNGLTCPSWMVDGKLITNLQILHLLLWSRLELLPPLGQLSCLKDLCFVGLPAIKKLGEEFYGKQIKEKVFFPSLEKLELKCMENLKEWDDIVIEDTSVMFFPCLKRLTIHKCSKLVSALPNMSIKDPSSNVANVMRSLSELDITDCTGLVVLELDILVSLKHLKITKCSNLTRITSAINVAATVETLSIDDCGKLEKMEFGSLSSLKNLMVSFCNELISFPRLVSIEELDVYKCEKLRSLNVCDPGLNSLQSLKVVKCPMLEILFEDASTSSSSSSSALPLSRLRLLKTDNILVFSKLFEHDLVSLRAMGIGRFSKVEMLNEIVKNNWHKLTLLENFAIFWCEDLKSLPPDIHKLSSLKKLWLHGCPKLQALPADGLPLSLELLVMIKCPQLYERCQMDSGPDWDKIKHVPERKTFINDEVFELRGIHHFGHSSLDLIDFVS